MAVTSEPRAAAPTVVAWFEAAAAYLNRATPACPQHGVRHTGKLARSIVLDLALLDATGEARHWERAVRRADDTTSRLAPDPDHGGLIYFPGRLDPRNCSNSIIDSGECTDAIARLLLHPRADTLDAGRRASFTAAVEQNAETYLARAVLEKTITNQRLWGAMGLASANRLLPRASWEQAVQAAVERAVDEQRDDGSWGYQPRAVKEGAHPGAADLTVYYHGRCLAFLMHILDAVPGLESERLTLALRRGLEFLAAMVTDEGLKPLALEGKRWFWDGSYEAGSNAYDLFALLRGLQRFGVTAWQERAARCWQQLCRHQRSDGAIVACAERGRHDVVCPDFHTADLAWTAQVLLPSPPFPPHPEGEGGFWLGTESPDSCGGTGAPPPAEETPRGRGRYFAQAGVVRLEGPRVVALIRTHTAPRNSQFGGPLGGGAIVYAGKTGDGAEAGSRPRRGAAGTEIEGNFTVYPAQPDPASALRRYLHHNPPGREGRQWLFVARLLLAEGHPLGAARRLWRGYLWPLVASLREAVATHWALTSTVELEARTGRVRLTAQPAHTDGSIPAWAARLAAVREYAVEDSGLRVIDELGTQRAPPEIGRAAEETARPGQGLRLRYVLPAAAQGLQISASEPVRRAGPGERWIELRPQSTAFSLRLTYVL